MAAEAVIGAALQLLFEKLIATAGEEISLMRGLKNEVGNLKESLEMVNAFLHDASRRQAEEHSVKLWLQKLEDLAYEADDILDDINYEALRRKVEIRNQMKRKVCFFFCFNNPLVFRSKMAHRIKDLNLKLEKTKSDASSLRLVEKLENSAISVPEVRETSSLTDDPIFVSRENEMSKIIDMLVQPSEEVLSVIPLTGMGGLGKTTLARKIFNDPKIVGHFKQRIWVCVSETFESKIIFMKMLEQSSVREESKEDLLQKLQEKLKNGNYLLVLDDLWNEDQSKWDDFRRDLVGVNREKGNFCLVTTRSERVASVVTPRDPQPLDKLSPDDCWLIIKEKAFPGEEVPEGLKEVGEMVASKCGGVPLAANMVGSSLKGKGIDEWTSFLQGGFSDLEEGENMVLQVLKISFGRLSSPIVKKCFAYCSIFCKDAELEKERLIQLWMAEGFLVGNDMENEGNRVYDLLLRNCFLQEAIRDEYGNTTEAKMHDLVHDLACSVSKMESFNVKNYKSEKSYPPRLRYLAIESLDEEEAFKSMRERAVYLRTLFFGGDMLSDRIFKDIKNLHVLVLQESNIKELTNSIGKLISLRLLDVSSTRIEAFPKDICKLFNLQTLRAIHCKLARLPKKLQQLVSLRHLVFDGNEDLEMPLQIGKLNSLQTLKFFIVGHEKGRCIEELGSLKNLKGELEICHLERVNNKEEACRASLIEKPNIYKLKFIWSHSSESNPTGSGSNTCNNNDEEVLEGLRPHSNIKSLIIKGFKGDHFPPWIMSSSVGATSNLHKLIEIQLTGCARCKEVPTLGHLPLLKILDLNGLKSVTSLGHSFYYPHGTSECSRQQTPPFRALRSFKLRGMTSLVEWNEAPLTTSTDESRADRAFPSLEELEIEDCPNIAIAPNHDFPALQTLKVREVENGSLLIGMISGGNASSLTTLGIDRVAGVTRVPCIGRCLEKLEINGCPDLQSIQFSSEGRLTSSSSLKYFVVRNCKALSDVILGDETTSADKTRANRAIRSLEELEIEDCPNIAIAPNHDFPALRTLKVRKVENGSWLIGIISGGNASSLTTLRIDRVAGVTRVPCIGRRLEKLEIHRCPDLQSIHFSSEGGSTSSSSLKSFVVRNCEALSDVLLGYYLDYASLEIFLICDCRNVSVSNPAELRRMPCLSSLIIFGCPKLRRLLVWGINYFRHLTELQLGPLSEEEGEEKFCEMLQGIHELQSLRSLELLGQPLWDSLPDQIQHLANLTKLRLYNFGSIEVLPEWLGKLSSLEWLGIFGFSSLRKLPSKEAMQRLTKVDRLSIWNCPLLKEIKNPGSDAYRSEWPKISHIRHVSVW